MQWVQVLRGCFVTYLVAVLMIGGGTIVFGDGGAALFGTVAFFGLFVAVPFVVAALISWAVLGGRRAHVQWWYASVITAGIFALLGMVSAIADGDGVRSILVVLAAAALGGAVGVVFWIGAFGFQRAVVMSTQDAP